MDALPDQLNAHQEFLNHLHSVCFPQPPCPRPFGKKLGFSRVHDPKKVLIDQQLPEPSSKVFSILESEDNIRQKAPSQKTIYFYKIVISNLKIQQPSNYFSEHIEKLKIAAEIVKNFYKEDQEPVHFDFIEKIIEVCLQNEIPSLKSLKIILLKHKSEIKQKMEKQASDFAFSFKKAVDLFLEEKNYYLKNYKQLNQMIENATCLHLNLAQLVGSYQEESYAEMFFSLSIRTINFEKSFKFLKKIKEIFPFFFEKSQENTLKFFIEHVKSLHQDVQAGILSKLSQINRKNFLLMVDMTQKFSDEDKGFWICYFIENNEAIERIHSVLLKIQSKTDLDQVSRSIKKLQTSFVKVENLINTLLLIEGQANTITALNIQTSLNHRDQNGFFMNPLTGKATQHPKTPEDHSSQPTVENNPATVSQPLHVSPNTEAARTSTPSSGSATHDDSPTNPPTPRQSTAPTSFSKACLKVLGVGLLSGSAAFSIAYWACSLSLADSLIGGLIFAILGKCFYGYYNKISVQA